MNLIETLYNTEMTRKATFCFVAVSLLIVNTVFGTGPEIISQDDPKGEAVRTAAASFLSRLSSGDVSGVRALFAGSKEDSQLLEAELHFVIAATALTKSATAAFGDSPALGKIPGGAVFQTISEQAAHGMIILNGDSATTVCGRTPNNGLNLQLIQGEWKVVNVASRREQIALLPKYYQAIADAMHDTQIEITAGRITDVTSALQYLQTKLQPVAEILASGGSTKDLIIRSTPMKPEMSIAQLRAVLGKPLDAPQVRELIAAMPFTPQLDLFSNNKIFVSSNEAGISLVLLPPNNSLHTIFLFGSGNDSGSAQYGAELPYGLSFGETRLNVERKLGAPNRIGGGDAVPTYVVYDSVGLGLTYGRAAPRDPDNPVVQVSLILTDSTAPAPTTQLARRSSPGLTFQLVVEQKDLINQTVEKVFDPANPNDPPLLVSQVVELDGRDIDSVAPIPTDETLSHIDCAVRMNAKGAARLDALAVSHKGERVAILLNGKLLMAPRLEGPIGADFAIHFGADQTKEQSLAIIDEIQTAVYSLPLSEKP